MSNKAALKAVRTALDSKDFQQAAEKAKDLVQQEPQNYHANVFLGLALDRLNQTQDAEKAYLAATRVKEGEKTAWQGLISVYEKQGSLKLDSYREAVLNLGQIFAEADDKHRCQDAVGKFIDFAKKHGSRSQYRKAIELHLPSSPLYDFLEGRVPHPAHTYLRLIEMTEAEEKEFINREIGERRTRLGARVDQVTLEVKREAFKRSELEPLYRGIVNWSHDDQVRRTYEEKLLERGCDVLAVLPANEKANKRNEVWQAARDMVIIKHPFELAWRIYIEWQDIQSFSEWDRGFLEDFIEFFPEHGLTKVLKGFLASDLSPFPKDPKKRKESKDSAANDQDADGSNGENVELAAQDSLILMVEGLEMSSSSVVAHRIVGEVYLSLEEYESVADVARKGLDNLQSLVKMSGMKLQNTTDSMRITLANALIYYQSPRNHPEAKRIFEEILRRNPKSTSCLLGIGLVLKVDEDYVEAVNFLGRALDRDPTNIKVRGELSWCKALNGDFASGLDGLQDVLSELQSTRSENREFKAEILYRIGYCQWEIDPSSTARKDRNGAYASFLSSIQTNMNFAPAYTFLGLYYADYKKDKTRARRCFHKAFELSASEIEAARRLAKTFADQKEWDLVEAVSQRVVDSGKAKPAPGSKRKGFSWPYAALGTVQINKQQYPKSIVSFQVALRISPGDYHSWVGLGESYHHSGRFIAATKAFEHAQQLEGALSSSDKEQIWFARYMLANVKRELGEFEDAISRYEEVLSFRPNEFGVSIALLQTLTENSWKSLELGLYNDSIELARKAVLVATSLALERVDIFNLWKGVGDACSLFAYVKAKSGRLPLSETFTLLSTQLEPTAFDILADVDEVGQKHLLLLKEEGEEGSTLSDKCMYASILAYKRAIHVSVRDLHAQAVSWYNLGWAEYRTYKCLQAASSTAGQKQSRKFLKAAMRCFKRAIELEAGNSEFWNALGVVTTGMSPKVAQHAFVRSLHLNDRSAQVWTNLGALYLIHNDIQLANEAFTRAQSTDPDYAQAWIGQGFLALLFGDPREARGLFEHAFDISSSLLVLPKQQYALSLFDHLMSDSSVSNEISQLIQPFFALHQLSSQNPSDLPFVHLSALLAERMGEISDAESSLRTVCSAVEAEYEVSESTSALSRFAQANADIARVLLAQHQFEEAAEKAEMALMLSGEEDAEKFDPETSRKLRLSAHLTAGLSHYYLKSMDSAIDMFRDALQEADNAPEVVCLLAQVLWAKGGEEERTVARQQLFDCVEANPDHVGAVTLLGAIAILDADKDVIEAVESDLQNMITRDDIEIHEQTKLVKLLTAVSTLGFGDNSGVPEETRRVGEAAAAVMRAPHQPQGWMELSAASEEPYAADMGVKRALRSVPPRGRLEAEDLSAAFAQTGKAGDALKAIMVAPWKQGGWEELNHATSTTA
ncbi:putative translation repressor/antiviral protein Ski3 [Aspergillus steynii IBT 23096]|uniref:Putative translation repressor/antiviral protein Ski3 n=1 Tax=Aspergillus steynii IBT 23096 TaxID=1392250 RepID=A0A2I2GIP3_9EURO|nr:putative translation repressor/antiviral protein Ski3 [Aspergillus steynii IBT 23096]PLB52740.1 putative translation repressor/antiviral protein Ski3 [Aspergillus steynii IBT 23096]